MYLNQTGFVGRFVDFLDNSGGASVALFAQADSTVDLQGGVIRGNVDTSVDAPITIDDSTAVLAVLQFVANANASTGYAALLVRSPGFGTYLRDLEFTGNLGTNFVAMLRDGPLLPIDIVRVVASENEANGVFDTINASVRFHNALMYANAGSDRPAIGGNIGEGRTLSITNSTLVDNDGEGVTYLASGTSSTLEIRNSIIANNGGAGILEVPGLGDEGVLLAYSNLSGNAIDTDFQPSNFSAIIVTFQDPVFAFGSSPAYQLEVTSPLRDQGDPMVFDPDGSRSDQGAYGGPNSL